MRRLLVPPLFFCGLSPAFASGGLWCDVDADKVKIAISSGMTRGMGSPLFNFEATVEIEDSELADDVRRTSYGHATQYWLDGETLNLLVYWEREGDGEFASVEATVMTRFSDDEGSYDGDYAITVHDGGAPTPDGEPRRYGGTISCGVE